MTDQQPENFTVSLLTMGRRVAPKYKSTMTGGGKIRVERFMVKRVSERRERIFIVKKH
jgi:hypothetical protein